MTRGNVKNRRYEERPAGSSAPALILTAIAIFGLAVLLLIQTGRALISLLFGASLPVAAGCYTTESVTDLFTLVLLWIVRRLDGVLEDQRHYLRRIQEEEET